jgi:hypothetical protein
MERDEKERKGERRGKLRRSKDEEVRVIRVDLLSL